MKQVECWVCLRELPIEVTHVHHIKPKHTGGSDDEDNLCRICPSCHQMIHSCAYVWLRKKTPGKPHGYDGAIFLMKRYLGDNSVPTYPLQRERAEELIAEAVEEMQEHGRTDKATSWLNRMEVPNEVRYALEVKAKQLGFKGWRPYLQKVGLAELAGVSIVKGTQVSKTTIKKFD